MQLQGHCNPISATCPSPDKQFVITADKGEDSLIAVWDAVSGDPIKTIIAPHENGVEAMDISPDGSLLVTLSAAEEGEAQFLGIWEIEGESVDPLHVSPLPVPDVQLKVHFHVKGNNEFVTTGRKKVVFWSWSEAELDYNIPMLSREDYANLGTNIGDFMHSVYLQTSNSAVTSTSNGNVILWDSNIEDEDLVGDALEGKCSFQHRALVKIVEMHTGSCITLLAAHDNLLVTCGSDGAVRFYDSNFRIIAWYEDIRAGGIQSLSFGKSRRPYSVANGEAAKKEVHFYIEDFVVATDTAQVIQVRASDFDEPLPANRKGSVILRGCDQRISCVATHPSEPIFLVASESGKIQAWNYETKETRAIKCLGKATPMSIAFRPDGEQVAVGCDNGNIRLLRWSTSKDLGELARFRIDPTVAYTKVAFSPDSLFLALCDTGRHVSLFRFLPEEVGPVDDLEVDQGKDKGQPGKGLEPSDGNENRSGWAYIGRYASHRKGIVGLSFAKGMEGEVYLATIGEDSKIVTYDVSNSCVIDGILLTGDPAIAARTSTPTSCLLHPVMPGLNEDLIISADDEYKFKLWNANTLTCRKTILGPTFGGPVATMINIPCHSNGEPCIAYAAKDRVVGLVKLPMEGNPDESMGLIAHPGEITAIASAYDGQWLITAGGEDLTINLWNVDTQALQCKSEESYLTLLEGGKEGELYKEIVEYFYYAQIREAPLKNLSPHDVDGKLILFNSYKAQIPKSLDVGRAKISEVPNMLRALGYYPSNADIKDIYGELTYTDYASSGKETTHITLEQFIRLYLNHRPVSGVSIAEIDRAFKLLEATSKDSRGITWAVLEGFLSERGEAISEKEMRTLVSTLIGDKASKLLLQQSGSHITSTDFARDVLGFEDVPSN